MMLEKKNVVFLVSSADDRRGVDLLVKTLEAEHPECLPLVFDESTYADSRSSRLKANVNKLLKPLGLGESVHSSEKKPSGDGKVKHRSAEFKKIYSIIIRFDPVCVVATNAKLLDLAVAANKKRKKRAKIVGLYGGFTYNGRFYNKHADAYIVDNSDVKRSLLGRGAQARSVLVAGVPCVEEKYDFEKVFEAKREMVLNDKPTVYLSGGVFGNDQIKEVLKLLLDQGDYINVVAYCGENEQLYTRVCEETAKVGAENVKVIMSGEMEHVAELASDIVICTYDSKLIASSVFRRVPVIVFGPKSAEEQADFEYLSQKRTVFYAENFNKVIIDLYKIIQTDVARFYRTSDDLVEKEPRLRVSADMIAGIGE